jgi:hypothetical protein
MLKAALKARARPLAYRPLGISPPKADEFESTRSLSRNRRQPEIPRRGHPPHTSGTGEPRIQSAQGEMLIEAAE